MNLKKCIIISHEYPLIPTFDEIHAAFSKGEPAIVDLFETVGKQIEGLASQLDKQNEVIKELQARLSKDSHNSSKPPFRSGYRKKPPQKRTESRCSKGQKPNGGQPGHKGQTLIASDTQDTVTVHEIEQCKHCQASLKEVKIEAIEESRRRS